jgi:hypothetical protein
MVIVANFLSSKTTLIAYIMTWAASPQLLIAFLSTCAHLEQRRKVVQTRLIWTS